MSPESEQAYVERRIAHCVESAARCNRHRIRCTTVQILVALPAGVSFAIDRSWFCGLCALFCLGTVVYVFVIWTRNVRQWEQLLEAWERAKEVTQTTEKKWQP